MDKRTQMILARARELFAQDHPGQSWPADTGKADTSVLALQGRYLSRAEDQLLAEGVIDCIDQS